MRRGNYSFFKKIISSPLVIFVMAVLFLFLVRVTWSMSDRSRLTLVKLSQAEAELKRLELRKAELNQKVSYLSTADGLANEIRSKYPAVRDGESVAVIVEDEHFSDEQDKSIFDSEQRSSWWHRLLQKIGL